jgi:hypothetical protein
VLGSQSIVYRHHNQRTALAHFGTITVLNFQIAQNPTPAVDVNTERIS